MTLNAGSGLRGMVAMTLNMCPRCWCQDREEYQLMSSQVMIRCRQCGYVFEVAWAETEDKDTSDTSSARTPVR